MGWSLKVYSSVHTYCSCPTPPVWGWKMLSVNLLLLSLCHASSVMIDSYPFGITSENKLNSFINKLLLVMELIEVMESQLPCPTRSKDHWRRKTGGSTRKGVWTLTHSWLPSWTQSSYVYLTRYTQDEAPQYLFKGKELKTHHSLRILLVDRGEFP